MKALALAGMVLMIGSLCYGESGIHTEAVPYKDHGKSLEGFLAYSSDMEGRRPGVLVIHEWRGLDDYAKERARQLAEMGYVAFALDMYGKGILAETNEEASKLSGEFFQDRSLMRERAQAGLNALREQEFTDPERIAVIGFCFGGTTALELAMSGADVKATITFHAVLNFPNTEGLKNIDGAVLILDGGRDPNVPPEDLTKLWAQMEEANVDYQINIYGGAVHSFTNPASGNDPSKGVAYDEVAARRSWREMQEFLHEKIR
jgi:dienelactone hydrolase